MASFSKEALELVRAENAALNKQPFTCLACHQEMRKSYCGPCDEFYNTGHSEDCPHRNDRGQEGYHYHC